MHKLDDGAYGLVNREVGGVERVDAVNGLMETHHCTVTAVAAQHCFSHGRHISALTSPARYAYFVVGRHKNPDVRLGSNHGGDVSTFCDDTPAFGATAAAFGCNHVALHLLQQGPGFEVGRYL